MSSVLFFVFDVSLIVYHPIATLTTLDCSITYVQGFGRNVKTVVTYIETYTCSRSMLTENDNRAVCIWWRTRRPSYCFTLARVSRCGAMSTEGLTDGNSVLRCKVALSVTRRCDAHAASRNLQDEKRTAKEISMSVHSTGRILSLRPVKICPAVSGACSQA
jgi:hypothetical protein